MGMHFPMFCRKIVKLLVNLARFLSSMHRIFIERDNSNTRNCLGLMTRCTKIVSKKEEMVYGSIKLWAALETPEIFPHYQKTFLSMFAWKLSIFLKLPLHTSSPHPFLSSFLGLPKIWHVRHLQVSLLQSWVNITTYLRLGFCKRKLTIWAR